MNEEPKMSWERDVALKRVGEWLKRSEGWRKEEKGEEEKRRDGG